MTIDLDALDAAHAALDADVAGYLGACAAVALERRHGPGVRLVGEFAGHALDDDLTWTRRGPQSRSFDAIHATQHGAYAIALGLVARHRPTWRLVRRLQSIEAERADWLFEVDDSREAVALEVSGTDQGATASRVREKRAQAAEATLADRAAACVVRFFEPRAIFWDSHVDE